MTKKIEILYEDDNVLVINKPVGLIVHPDGKTKERTAVDWVIEKYPKIKGVGESTILKNGKKIERPGIVHRIDRDTSGCLIIAKTDDSYKYLKRQFKEREIKKVYRAFVYGTPKEPRGIIERKIQRSKNDFRKWTAYSGRGEGREAITQYRVLNSTKGCSYIEMRPKTGRTHQLRVHFSSIGHPIIGDNLYGKGKPLQLGFQRLALHAYSIEFKIGNPGEDARPLKIEAPLPADFIKAEKEMMG